jgi:hypothetical protein
MLETEITINRFLVGYCRLLVEDVSDDRFAEQPLVGINHPAWTLGHLAVTAEKGAALFGGESELPEDWGAKFGPGSTPTSARSDYPSKADLIEAVDEAFERFRSAASAATPEQLSAPSTHPRTKRALPQVKDLAAFLMTGHFGIHLGQLTMWRRLIGLPHMF